MTTRAQKTVIAFLIPLALASAGYAVYAWLEYRRGIELEKKHLALKEKVEEGRYTIPRKIVPEETKPPARDKDEYPRLYIRREMADMSPAERAELAGEMLALLRLGHAGADQKYRAYVTLVNCREAAHTTLLEALKSDNMLEVYYALKACTDLKDLYHVDVKGGDSFLDAALRIRPDAPPDVKMQMARLLGLYRDERATLRLEKLAAENDDTVRYNALLSLSRVGRATTLPVVARALDSADPAVLAAACRAMSALVGFGVGAEFTLTPDYFGGLSDDARRWRAWWEANKANFTGHS